VIGVGAVKSVRVKRHDVARIELAIDELHAFQSDLHALGIRADLLAALAVIDASDPVRTSQDL
jgi:hypothetical protein